MKIKNFLFKFLILGVALNFSSCGGLKEVSVGSEYVNKFIRNYEEFVRLKEIFNRNEITLSQRHDLFDRIHKLKSQINWIYCGGLARDYCIDDSKDISWRPKYDFEKSNFKTKYGEITLKDTSLISVTGLVEIMRQSYIAAGSTRDPLFFYSFAAVLYLSLTFLSMKLINRLEIKYSRGF